MVLFVRFIHRKIMHPRPNSSSCSEVCHTFGMGRFASPQRWSIYKNCLEFSAGDFSLLPCLFISIWTGGLFVCFNRLWILIQYDFMLLLNVYQLWPLVISSASSWVLLLYPHHCKGIWFCLFVCVHFLTFWHYKVLQVHLVYFLPQA